MHSQTFFLGAGALFGLAQGAALLEDRTTNPSGMVCNADNCLRALRRFSLEAIPFCSTYINIPKVTVTVIASTTATQLATITIPGTISQTSTTTTIIPVTVTTTRIVNKRAPEIIFGKPLPTVAARDQPLPSYVSQYPASRVSSACSCMTVPQATTTTTVTSIQSTILSTSITSTFTVKIVATSTSLNPIATAPSNNCATTYDVGGTTPGTTVITVSATDDQDCCQQCQNSLNCVANAFLAVNNCQLLTRVKPVEGGEITELCPLGIQDYFFGEPKSGRVYAGPCGF